MRRRGRQRGRGAVLKGFEDAEKQTLAGRGEQVDAIEIGEADEGGGVGVGYQPFAGVAALEGGISQRGAFVEITGQGLLAASVLTLDGGYLDVGGGHFSLHKEFAPCRAYAYDLVGVGESNSISARPEVEG